MQNFDLERLHNHQNRLDYITLRIKFILPIIFILTSFTLIIIMLLLSVARNPGDPKITTSAIGVLETISSISQSSPVVEIKTITGSQICDTSTFEPGNLGTWRALDYGCYCPLKNALERRRCAITESDCQNIARLPEIETESWNGDRFCLRRLTDFIRTSGLCPTSYSKCGTLICVPKGEACPISDVKVIEDTASIPPGYKAEPMTSGRKIVYTNTDTSSNKQFARFSYVMGAPCLDNNAFSVRSNAKTYPLEFEKHIGCNEYGRDAEGEYLDMIEEDKFNLLNGIKDQTDRVPNYNSVTDNSLVSLWARYRFITIDSDLCAQYYVTNVPQLMADVEDFAYLYRGIAIAGTAMGLITSMIAFVYIRVLSRDGFWIVNKEETFGRRFLVQIVLLHTLYAVVTTILGNLALHKISTQEAYLESIESNDCFKSQPLLNDAMDVISTYLTNTVDGLVLLNNILAFIAGGTTLVVILNLLFRKQRQYDGFLGGQR